MNPQSLDQERRHQILEAARHRLEHYGYEKTTMAEIAADAGIAVGTLYLYFRNKEDLRVAFGEECQKRYLDSLERIARSGLPPAERLRQLARLRVLAIKEEMEATPHGGDILLRMMQKGHACCRGMQEREVAMIEEILREGAASGEFSVPDPARTARVFRSAFAGFMPPACLGRPSEEITREIDALYTLLVRGLRAASAAPRAGVEAPPASGATAAAPAERQRAGAEIEAAAAPDRQRGGAVVGTAGAPAAARESEARSASQRGGRS